MKKKLVESSLVPRITACICTYNRYDLLPKAVDSLLNQSIDRALYKVMVIDNSPRNDEGIKLASYYETKSDNIEYRFEKTPGLSNARNVAANNCGTEFIAYMDDDAVAEPNWLKGILDAFDFYKGKAAVVGGKVDPIWASTRPHWLDHSLLGYVSVVNWGGELRQAQESEWFAGTNIAFNTNVLIEQGLFDTKLGRSGGGFNLLSNEETELVKRIKNTSSICVYQPGAVVQHLVDERRLSQEWYRKRVAWQAASDFLMNPEKSILDTKNGWGYVMQFFFSLPPKVRNIRGLYTECETSEKFKHQLASIYHITIAMLNGFDGVDFNSNEDII